MATIVTRSGKGSELSFAEVDGNFTGLASDTATLFGRVYTPVATIAAIPASPADGDRIEIINSTGIRSLLNVQNIPADFPSSGDISGLQVRLQYSSSLSAWQWVSYEAKAPDARYVLQSNISSSTSSTSTTTVASSAAVKAAKDAADTAQATADQKAATLNAVLLGTPTAPTAVADTSTTQIATTAFVLGQASQAVPLVDGTAAVGTSSRLARADHVHPTDTSRAPLASPNLQGTPTAPTAAANTSTTQIATTAFVLGQASTGTPLMDAAAAAIGTSTAFARADHVHPSDSSRAPLTSPNLLGTPTAPTAAVDTNTTQLATTAFVVGQGYLKSSTATSTYAPLTSPGLLGTPTAPTAAVDTNTTQLATTAFVVGQGYLKSATATSTYAPLTNPNLLGTPTAPTAAVSTNTTQLATTAFVVGQASSVATAPLMDGSPSSGTSLRYTREDHVHPTDTSRAPVNNPQFTGNATAPTQAINDSSTKLATTAFVLGQVSTTTPLMNAGTAAIGTATTFARADHAHPTDTSRAPVASPTFTGTVTIPAGASISGFAPLASPVFTGIPEAPTAAAGTNTTQLATTAFVAAATGTLAPLASPQLTGTPTAPTAAAGTNTTQLATTAFVATATANALPVLGTQQSPTAGATNITFTGIPSWAKRVTLSWSALTMASGYAMLRLGTSSGLKTSGYGTAPSTNYTWIKSIGGGESIYVNYTDLGVYYFVGIYAGSGNVSIVKMSSTAWMISGMSLHPSASYVVGYQAYQVLASDLTQIALVGDGSSTFSAGGNINIMYE